MKVYLVDDEPLAVRRLRRLLQQSGRVDVVGAATDPELALVDLARLQPDVCFLDIEMPGMSGFEMLERLGEPQPLVVFTTAFDRYALRAFEVHSIDYLLKPIEPAFLDRALGKLERLRAGQKQRVDLQALAAELRAATAAPEGSRLARVASRVGDRIDLIDVATVTHFVAEEKLTYAVTSTRRHAIDLTLADLEARLDPRHWVRIHRGALLRIGAVKEVHAWFGGRIAVKLREGDTLLTVARERTATVRAKLGL